MAADAAIDVGASVAHAERQPSIEVVEDDAAATVEAPTGPAVAPAASLGRDDVLALQPTAVPRELYPILRGLPRQSLGSTNGDLRAFNTGFCETPAGLTPWSIRSGMPNTTCAYIFDPSRCAEALEKLFGHGAGSGGVQPILGLHLPRGCIVFGEFKRMVATNRWKSTDHMSLSGARVVGVGDGMGMCGAGGFQCVCNCSVGVQTHGPDFQPNLLTYRVDVVSLIGRICVFYSLSVVFMAVVSRTRRLFIHRFLRTSDGAREATVSDGRVADISGANGDAASLAAVVSGHEMHTTQVTTATLADESDRRIEGTDGGQETPVNVASGYAPLTTPRMARAREPDPTDESVLADAL
eukprot:TRINITY_DN27718_c0_g3_i1.p1 TRINITY_DN27718_c0_g3~~TRINITY_DN27718_c0_g3_i1.p1  ORF type:complete len:353 (-),score=43.02 TRINITY_DN27718_c0_g3_i1:99-1157(-)